MRNLSKISLFKEVFFLRSNPMAPDPRVEKEAVSLAKYGYKITVVGWDREGNFSEFEQKEFFSIRRIKLKAKFGSGIKNIKHLLKFQIVLLNFLVRHRNEYNYIHACDFDTIIPALICKLLFKKKVVYDIFDFYADMLRSVPKWLRAVIRKIDLFLIGFPDAVILVDDSRVEQIKGSKPKKLVFIYNSIPEELLEDLENKDKKPRTLTIGYVGLLQFERGLIPIINVVKKHPNWKLILAGYGAEEDKIKEVSQEVDNIEFLGRVSYEEALKIYSNCGALFATYDPSIPNHRYSSANKLFEAMALGKPIIVARNTGMDKLVEKYNLGFVVDYGSEEQIENALTEIEGWDNDKFSKFSERVKIVYKENFAWEIMEERLIELYNEL